MHNQYLQMPRGGETVKEKNMQNQINMYMLYICILQEGQENITIVSKSIATKMSIVIFT